MPGYHNPGNGSSLGAQDLPLPTKVGIIVGAIVFTSLVFYIFWFFYRKRNQNRIQSQTQNPANHIPRNTESANRLHLASSPHSNHGNIYTNQPLNNISSHIITGSTNQPGNSTVYSDQLPQYSENVEDKLPRYKDNIS